MAKPRKMLGRAQDPAIQALMRQMDTQSAHTLAAWAIACARARYLPLFEAACPGDARPRAALDAAQAAQSGARTLREAITVAGQSEFISRELPVALMNKYFEYQTQLCHDAEGAPDTESWERAHSFLII